MIRITTRKENVKSQEYKRQIHERSIGVDRVGNEVEIVITFDLGVSSYATAFLREMGKCKIVGVR